MTQATAEALASRLKAIIRDVPDFPKKGIIFKDITPLLSDPDAFREMVRHFAARFRDAGITKVLGIEARGFLLAAPYIRRLEHPVVDVSCFQWRSSLGIHQFCPELNVTVTGPTVEEVAERMAAALREHRGSGTPMGNIGDELIVRHMVDS